MRTDLNILFCFDITFLGLREKSDDIKLMMTVTVVMMNVSGSKNERKAGAGNEKKR